MPILQQTFSESKHCWWENAQSGTFQDYKIFSEDKFIFMNTNLCLRFQNSPFQRNIIFGMYPKYSNIEIFNKP